MVPSQLRLRSWSFLFAALAASLPAVALARLPAAGKPTFKASDPEAFWLWHDEAGWHLRATTGKAQHGFRGVLRAKGITDVSVTRPTLLTKVTATGDTLRFDYDLFAGGTEGFDFKSDDKCLSVEMRLDNKPQPDHLHVGSAGTAAAIFPVDVCY